MFNKMFSWQTFVPVLFFLLSLGSLLTWYGALPELKEENQQLTIAVVVQDLKQPTTADQEQIEVAEIFVGQNRQAFSNRYYTLSIALFEDGNQVERAMEVAQQIAQQPNVIGVVGHQSAAVVKAVMPVYEKSNLPLITHLPVSPEGERQYQYLYSIQPDQALESEFTLRYLQQIHSGGEVYLLSMQEGLQHQRIKTLSGLLNSSGMEHEAYYLDRELSTAQFAQRLTALVNSEAPVTLIIDATEKAGAVLVSWLREQRTVRDRIIGFDAMKSQLFIETLQQKSAATWQEDVNDLYVISPYLQQLLSSEAGRFALDYQAMTQKMPSINAIQQYVAIRLLGDALVLAVDDGFSFDHGRSVNRVLKQIGSLQQAVDGANSKFFFTESGRIIQPFIVARYREGELNAAPQQLLPLGVQQRNPSTVLSGMPLVITDLLFSGAEIRRIEESAVDNGYVADLKLWIRAESPVDLADVPLHHKQANGALQSIKPKRAVQLEQESYVEYHLKQPLQRDSEYRPTTASGEMLSLTLEPELSSQPKRPFRLVIDNFGMPRSDGQLWLQRLRRVGGIDHPDQWVAMQLNTAMERGEEEILPKSLRTHLNGKQQPRLSLQFLQVQATNQVIGVVEESEVGSWLILTVLLMALLIYLTHIKQALYYPLLFPLLAVMVVATLTLSERVLIELHQTLPGAMTQQLLDWAPLAWWIGGTLLILLAIHVWGWDRMKRKSGRGVPQILKGFVSTVVVIFMGFAIAAFVFKLSITAALAASGAVIVPIGLALRPLILDLFTGLAINMEGPFRVKDWIKVNIRGVNEAIIGRVEEVTWRSLRIWTTENNMTVVPNHKIAELSLVNFSAPNSMSRFDMFFTVGYEVPTEQVVRLASNALKELALTGLILDHPKKSKVKINGMTGKGVEYLLRYYLDLTKGSPSSGRNNVTNAVMNHLSHFSIRPSYHVLERQESTVPARMAGMEEKMVGGSLMAVKIKALENINLFHHLDVNELQTLSQQSQIIRVEAGTALINQGDQGDSMYVMIEGLVGVDIRKEDGEMLRVATLKPGNYFGEMSLLLHDPRSASVVAIRATKVLEIGFSAMQQLLTGNPEVAQLLSIEIDRRLQQNQAQKRASDEGDERRKSENSILGRMKSLFGF